MSQADEERPTGLHAAGQGAHGSDGAAQRPGRWRDRLARSAIALTHWWPDNALTMWLRGAVVGCFAKRCGRDLRLQHGFRFRGISNIAFGDHVYLARGVMIDGTGPVSIESEVVFGPYARVGEVLGTERGAGDQPGPSPSQGKAGNGGGPSAPQRDAGRGGAQDATRDTVIGRGSWVAAHAVVGRGLRVGAANIVGGCARVTRDTPYSVVVGGDPAEVVAQRQDSDLVRTPTAFSSFDRRDEGQGAGAQTGRLAAVHRELRHGLGLWAVGLVTWLLGDGAAACRVRGWLARPFIGRCGPGLKMAREVHLAYAEHFEFGRDVQLAPGVWLNAMGGMTVGDRAHFGVKVAISSGIHCFRDNSVRFGGTHLAAVKIGDDVQLGAHCIVNAGVTVGNGAKIAPRSAVLHDVPARAHVAGTPAQVIAGNEACGGREGTGSAEQAPTDRAAGE